MANFLKDNGDLLYYLGKGLDWARVAELTEYGYRDPNGFKDSEEAHEFYREICELVGEFVANEVAPLSRVIDRQGVSQQDGEAVVSKEFDALFKQVADLDLYGLALPRCLGGMNAPMLVYFISTELFARADVSLMAHYGFHGGIATALYAFSVLEGSTEFGDGPWDVKSTRFPEAIAEILAGKAWGSMDITEPDAGSDMASLRTVGELDDAGNWTVTGQKIFLTSGHGKYHFVIARTEKPGADDDMAAGLKGLSMFLVPAFTEKDGERVRLATLDRVEEKLGHHGSITAAVSFDKTPAHLIGERGEGFKYMLFLMNNARIGVAFETIGLCEAAMRMARAYASERPSMGKTIDRHELIADYLDEMEIDIIGLRAITMAAAVYEEIGEKTELTAQASGSDLEIETARRLAKKYKNRARRLTPLIKYLGAEKAVEIARRCLQIHGGNGYTTEYGAEKLLRDALVMPIYEGTSQIQALMAMKDTLGKVMASPQDFVRRVAQTRWRSLSARDPLERRVAKLQSISLGAQQHLMTRTATDKVRSLQGVPLAEWPKQFMRNWDPKRDFAFALLHAERLTKILADEAICETLLAQAKRHPERREYLERYLERAEPRCRYWSDEITSTGQRLLDKLAGKLVGSSQELGDESQESG